MLGFEVFLVFFFNSSDCWAGVCSKLFAGAGASTSAANLGPIILPSSCALLCPVQHCMCRHGPSFILLNPCCPFSSTTAESDLGNVNKSAMKAFSCHPLPKVAPYRCFPSMQTQCSQWLREAGCWDPAMPPACRNNLYIPEPKLPAQPSFHPRNQFPFSTMAFLPTPNNHDKWNEWDGAARVGRRSNWPFTR